MTSSDKPDLTPIDDTENYSWEIDAEKLHALRHEIRALIDKNGLRVTQEATDINPMRLYYLVELENTHKTRRTLRKLCDYFCIHISVYAEWKKLL